MDILAYGEKNLARNQEENDKKFAVKPCRVGEREESLKTFEKGELNKSRSDFKKTYSRISIDRKLVLIDRNRQKLTKIFKRNFD